MHPSHPPPGLPTPTEATRLIAADDATPSKHERGAAATAPAARGPAVHVQKELFASDEEHAAAGGEDGNEVGTTLVSHLWLLALLAFAYVAMSIGLQFWNKHVLGTEDGQLHIDVPFFYAARPVSLLLHQRHVFFLVVEDEAWAR